MMSQPSGETGTGSDPSGTGPSSGDAGNRNGGAGAGAGMDLASRLPSNAVIVEVGINNDSFVEILSGLEEGMEVIIPASNATSGRMNVMTFGGPGGGMAVGGGPAVMVTR